VITPATELCHAADVARLDAGSVASSRLDRSRARSHPVRMPDLRPVAHIIGLMLVVLGLTMLIPMAVSLAGDGRGWYVFLQSSVITVLAGAFLALSTANALSSGMTLRQTFLLTTLTWVVLPAFGAIPFLLGSRVASAS
jgi:trk system potassium uptake protein